MKKIFSLIFSMIILVSCGGGSGGSNSDIQNSINGEALEIIPAEKDEVTERFGLNSYDGTDSRGNQIKIYIQPELNRDDVLIEEGLNYGVPDSFKVITNNYIRVNYPNEIRRYQTIRIKPVENFNTLLVRADDGSMAVMPYSIKEKGFIEFVLEPINQTIEFLLVVR